MPDESTNIVEMSEQYFRMADQTVSAAEKYSESIATVIRYLEIGTAVDMADKCMYENKLEMRKQRR